METSTTPISINSLRARVMQLAHALRKSGFSLAQSLRRAWATVKLKVQMMVQPVSFFYLKDDGSERMAVGFMGAAPVPTTTTTQSGSLLVVKYYDTLAGGWRSFRADRLLLD